MRYYTIIKYCSDTEERYIHWCDGCDMLHQFITKRVTTGPKWSFNNDSKNPSFSPSMLVRYGDIRRCHYFLREGSIIYLNDSTHHLSGKTVLLPPLPEWSLDEDEMGNIISYRDV